jgi:uncharacterized protein
VLDTNATLDWLVFNDPAMRPLSQSIDVAQVRWLASPCMRDELEHMLRHPRLSRWSPDPASALQTFDTLATVVCAPAPGLVPLLRCSDSDDQVFIDLAIAQGASWLVTHDRALLKLARRARKHGVLILQPARWRLLPTP